MPIWLSNDIPMLDLIGLRLFSSASVRCSSRIRTPCRRVVQIDAVGAPGLGHDVFGTGWQIVGRAMQSITTMMPVWQCGHSRNDRPVSASQRSR